MNHNELPRNAPLITKVGNIHPNIRTVLTALRTALRAISRAIHNRIPPTVQLLNTPKGHIEVVIGEGQAASGGASSALAVAAIAAAASRTVSGTRMYPPVMVGASMEWATKLRRRT